MKKMNVNIANPCHENWDAMTATEKGKFCTSCQKTVVDFTNMNDNEIIQFFSRAKGSVCGRLTDKQLSKDLVLPSKPIPWIKYFFRFTFPAFILSLKSCIPNPDPKHSVKISYQLPKPSSIELMGDTILQPKVFETCTVGEILSNDIIEKKKTNSGGKVKHNSQMKIEPLPLIDTPQFQIPADKSQFSIELKKRDRYDEYEILAGKAGGLIVTSIRIQSRPAKFLQKLVDTVAKFGAVSKIELFPNPVQLNSPVNLKLNNIVQGDYLLSVLSLSGTILQNEQIRIDVENTTTQLDLKIIVAGTYIVRFVNRSTGKSIAQKLIVL